VDEFGKSPLHYAAQRGATTCSLYLIQRKVQLEREDSYGQYSSIYFSNGANPSLSPLLGNTPLSTALASDHPDYGIMLIQKSANVKHKLVIVTEKKEKDPETGEEEVVIHKSESSMFYKAVSAGWHGVAYMVKYFFFCICPPQINQPTIIQIDVGWRLRRKPGVAGLHQGRQVQAVRHPHGQDPRRCPHQKGG